MWNCITQRRDEGAQAGPCIHFLLLFPSLTLFSAPLAWPHRSTPRASRMSS